MLCVLHIISQILEIIRNHKLQFRKVLNADRFKFLYVNIPKNRNPGEITEIIAGKSLVKGTLELIDGHTHVITPTYL